MTHLPMQVFMLDPRIKAERIGREWLALCLSTEAVYRLTDEVAEVVRLLQDGPHELPPELLQAADVLLDHGMILRVEAPPAFVFSRRRALQMGAVGGAGMAAMAVGLTATALPAAAAGGSFNTVAVANAGTFNTDWGFYSIGDFAAWWFKVGGATTTWTPITGKSRKIRFLLVGGGGGGGTGNENRNRSGGGGGAGGVYVSEVAGVTIPGGQAVTFTQIGVGGSGGTGTTAANNTASTSTIWTNTTTGTKTAYPGTGGRGVSNPTDPAATARGAGGGGYNSSGTLTAGVTASTASGQDLSVQGLGGGASITGSNNNRPGGGGGGAGGAGGTAANSTTGGAGGTGYDAVTDFGYTVKVAGGGGGFGRNTEGTATDGGGTGGSASVSPLAGVNPGSGGGGGGYNNGFSAGAAGSAGIIIIREVS
ncbi:MAG: hypothetical protein Q8M73_05440 [Actinomycetota bacterium]|nr:hypothetical protein [Actinomycetota bacterium]